ncbi:unnamed protein product [Orchesella dallaii]
MGNGNVPDSKLRKDGLMTSLPVPFAKGEPADVQKMTVHVLRRFINFAYSSFYKSDLPNPVTATSVTPVQPPVWWPSSITFDKTLALRRGLRNREHQKKLTNLVWQFYDFHGFASLLAISAELAESRSKRFSLDKGRVKWKVVDTTGRTIVIIDQQTRAYDSNPQVIIEPLRVPNFAKTRNEARSKPNPKRTRAKRPFVESDKEEESLDCQYCQKRFRYTEFREDHEQVCSVNTSTSEPSQKSFMSALGLLEPSDGPKANPPNIIPPPVVKNGRTLRRPPKRNQLLSLIRNNPISITSNSGKRFLAELGEKVPFLFPPTYESCCKPKGGMGMPEPKFNTVTKRAILKDGEYPHIYSYGRLQRVKRYQELVIGLCESKWKILNDCKPCVVRVERVHSDTQRVKIYGPGYTAGPYVERCVDRVLNGPRVILEDCMKYSMDEDFLKNLLIDPKKLPEGIHVAKKEPEVIDCF